MLFFSIITSFSSF